MQDNSRLLEEKTELEWNSQTTTTTTTTTTAAAAAATRCPV
jgi:hypothetical protein